MKFRTKPVVVEAEQFFKDKLPWPKGVIDGNALPFITQDRMSCTLPHIATMEGHLIVHDGDWVITGVAGEKYPCKDAIFKQTYESV